MQYRDGDQAQEVLPVRRARVPSTLIFELTEAELDALEGGTPTSLYLNFAIWLLTQAEGFGIALLTTHIESDRLWAGFLAIASVSLVGGAVLLALWLRTRSDLRRVSDVVRKRLGVEPSEVPDGVHGRLDPRCPTT